MHVGGKRVLCVCMFRRRPQIGVNNYPQHSLEIFIKARSLSQTQSLLIYPGFLVRLLWDPLSASQGWNYR